MENDFLEKLKKISGNKYAAIASDGIVSGEVTGYVDTGSYVLNALVSGSIFKGIPIPKISVFAGESTTGKTFFLISVLSNYLKQYSDGTIVFFESEGALSRKDLETRGVDVSRVIMLPVATVEEFRLQSQKILDDYLEIPKKERTPMMMALDSYGMLSTLKEMIDTADDKKFGTRDMTRSTLTKGTFRVLTLKLGLAGVPLLVTNHTYNEIGLFPKRIMGGGQGIHLGASSVLFLSKKKEKEGTDVVGNIIHCGNYKSRLTVENKIVDVLLRYDTGLNKYYGLVNFAVGSGIWKKVATRIELQDGMKVFESVILKNPETYFTQEILDACDNYAKQTFLYGSEL